MKKLLIVFLTLGSFSSFAQRFEVLKCQVGDASETEFSMYTGKNPKLYDLDLTGGLTFEYPGYGKIRLAGYITLVDTFVIPGRMLRNDSNISNIHLSLRKPVGRIGRKFDAELKFNLEGNNTTFIKPLKCKKL